MFETFDIYDDVSKKPKELKIERLLPLSFTALMIGKPGSGKSSLIESMLMDSRCFYHKFDLVLFMAPYEIGKLKLFEDRKTESLNIQWIYSKIAEEKMKRTVKNCLVIIDDLVSQVNKDDKNPELIDLVFNRRKIVPECEISLLFTTQKYTMFPAKFRSTLQWMIFFNLPPDDYNVLSKQQIFNPPPHLKSVMSAHFRSFEHNFIYLRLDKYGLFLNFKKQI